MTVLMGTAIIRFIYFFIFLVIRFFHPSHHTGHLGKRGGGGGGVVFALKQWMFSWLKHDTVHRVNNWYWGSKLWQQVSARLTSATNVLLTNAEKCLPSNYRLCHWSRVSHVPVIVAPGNASAAEWQRREASVRRLNITGTCVLREGKPLQKTTGPPGWGLGVGLTTPPRKNHQVTETATMNSNPQSPMEISSQAPELGSMTAPSGYPSREAMSSRRNFLGT